MDVKKTNNNDDDDVTKVVEEPTIVASAFAMDVATTWSAERKQIGSLGFKSSLAFDLLD